MREKFKKAALGLSVPMTLAVTSVPVFAETTGTANSAVVSAMTTTANDMVATGTAILPVALTVVGLALVVTFGIRIFKSVAKK